MRVNRLINVFKTNQPPLLSVFYTAGFPQLNDTVRIALALEAGGADIIEIGIPFSDPVADGPTIQQSNKVALENGINVKRILDQVRDIRKKSEIPIVLMGYLNPVMQYGIESFVADAAAAGVDGLILPDLPLADFERNHKALFEKHNLSVTFLISPTTSADRIRKIDALSSGFIYAVSASSTTGAKKGFSAEQLEYFERIRQANLQNPVMIGFGISDRNTFTTAGAYANGAIIGSAFITLLSRSADLEADVIKFVKEIKGQ